MGAVLSGFFGLGGGTDRTRCQAEDCGKYSSHFRAVRRC
ncbi:hypothetical protein BN135_2539 [Cronobacter muytjensii 530]